MTQRWTFTDQGNLSTWTLPRNPRAMGPLQPSRRTTASGISTTGVVRVLRQPQSSFPWQFEGRLRTQAEYASFKDWATRGHITITDHLGRKHSVVPTGFEPTPYRPPHGVPASPWLFDYVFKTLYLGRL